MLNQRKPKVWGRPEVAVSGIQFRAHQREDLQPQGQAACRVSMARAMFKTFKRRTAFEMIALLRCLKTI
jgi:hypothetical protein